MFRKGQNFSKVSIGFTCLVGLLSFLLINAGCGASRQSVDNQEESIDIDALLGEDDIATTNRNSDEAEVLRLLGITPSEEGSESPPVEMVDNTSSDFDTVGDDVAQLRDDLDKKEKEISELRAQLSQKDMKISDLEGRTSRGGSVSAIPRGNSGEPSYEFKLRYQEALSQFKSRNYQQALSIFSQLIQADPSNSLSDNCQYWIGESYYGMTNYNQAIAEFEKVFSFANSNKSDDAQLKLGLCYMRLGERAQARAEFDRLLSVYPDSEYRSAAQRYISRL